MEGQKKRKKEKKVKFPYPFFCFNIRAAVFISCSRVINKGHGTRIHVNLIILMNLDRKKIVLHFDLVLLLLLLLLLFFALFLFLVEIE